ncbi:BREX-1 system adenine-specific DNA-methyltransferase PglX [Georgenia sp. Marseille-Q6866]
MGTAPLKNFATWARTALIREVTARIAAVLAPGSSGGVEQAKAVAALEKAIAAFGGGSEGRAAVADKVAYTWFNRIIALRFMDANGYTGIGVVSPQAGVEVGQPEVLAEAKRGVIDAEVVSDATRKTVAALLDGTLASGDPQGEAYALLLADYCRYWNKAMPFIFEREGDFTELLIPANLLADDSVLNRSVKVLTEDVCQDVEVIGWLYQFYISERKDEVFAGFKKNKKAGAAEIPAATQLFTPHWIVRYLVENSLGRLWMLNHPNSGLVSQMDYYIAPVDEETDFLKITKPEELKVIDPACGSGHMLTYAFDLLYAIYEEEGYAPSEIPGLILTHNLYGTEIDPRAGALAAFALIMKARDRQRTFFNKQVAPNICVIEPISFTPDELGFLTTKDGDKHAEEAFWNQFAEADTLGSLIQPDANLAARLGRHLDTLDDEGDMLKADTIESGTQVVMQAEYLGPRYAVVVANPPYMGGFSMGARLSEFAKSNFPVSKSDLFAMFIERNLDLASPRGYVAMVTMQSWMFLSSFTALRERLLKDGTVATAAHLGPNAFGAISGDVVSTVAFVISKVIREHAAAAYFKLVDGPSEAAKSSQLLASARGDHPDRFVVDQADLRKIPGSPIAYWVDHSLVDLYSQPLIGDRFEIKAGVGTRNDYLFMKFSWEVSASRIGPGRRWVLTDKAGEFRKWYAGFVYVMDWENDGRRIKNYRNPDGSLKSRPQNVQFMFREGVTWGKIGAGAASFRWRPEGYGFNDAAPAIFGAGAFDLLAQLNSNVGRRLVEVKGSTVNVQTGMVAELPIVPLEEPVRDRVRELTQRAVQIAKDDWDSTEISPEFRSTPFVDPTGVGIPLAARHLRVVSAQDAAVAELTQIETEINWIMDSAVGGATGADPQGSSGAVTLLADPRYRYGRRKPDEVEALRRADAVRELVSYAVGCMFGRFSLDKPGLILADQGATLHDYVANVPSPTFMPDADNVIPIVDGDWFEDDIVERFRQFLRAAFGDEHFEENLRFVTESLGMKNLRDYFVKSFYKAHVQRYKKRPIYWLFSSPKGSFNALIYMHRYTPSTVSTVLNEYLREFQAKLKASLEHAERSNSAKEADRLRKMLLEVDDYEHNVLYPLASKNIVINLDDGVRANYPMFGAALKRIPGLEATE